jgi:hypothetical protein
MLLLLMHHKGGCPQGLGRAQGLQQQQQQQ